MKKIKLQHLRFFVAVYEERSITAAAEKVHATQSGVSVQVRDLEQILGLSLFERSSSGVAPTKAGDRIYQRVAVILREIGKLEEEVSDQSKLLSGEVRVGVMPTFARAILAPVLTHFLDANPMVEVKVTEGYSAVLTEMVRAGELDLAVVPRGDLGNGLRSTFLETDLEILVSPQPLDGVTGGADLSAVPPLKLALPGPGNARRAKIDQHLNAFSGAVHSVLEMDSMMTTLNLVRQGEWCSILPGCLCLPDLENSGVHLHPIIRPNMTVDYLLIEPATKEATTVVQLFSDQLVAEIRKCCEIVRAHFLSSRVPT
ncbi:LysR family transcriptional regulator [Labrenzia sp. CE80]|uniref:LysR family transcriptional regulator n=1 Tax=Labrenzia sp. CE80 TaxID=1788986 RepID=UPI00129B9385|nr:LysR family transcriptional regulator [Labrenzia sp. CE80]